MNYRLFSAGVCAALTTAALASAASAESFTFTYANEGGTVVSAASHGGSIHAASWKGISTTTATSGATVKSSFQCTLWSTPGQSTDSSMICNLTDTTGDKYSVTSNCIDLPKGANMCWGFVQGVSGKYAGKVGALSQIGSGATGAGQGAWAD